MAGNELLNTFSGIQVIPSGLPPPHRQQHSPPRCSPSRCDFGEANRNGPHTSCYFPLAPAGGSPPEAHNLSVPANQDGLANPCHPAVELRANLKSISHRCHLEEVAFVWELTKETMDLPLGCLQGGYRPLASGEETIERFSRLSY